MFDFVYGAAMPQTKPLITLIHSNYFNFGGMLCTVITILPVHNTGTERR